MAVRFEQIEKQGKIIALVKKSKMKEEESWEIIKEWRVGKKYKVERNGDEIYVELCEIYRIELPGSSEKYIAKVDPSLPSQANGEKTYWLFGLEDLHLH